MFTFSKFSMLSINCMYNLFVFNYTIRDIVLVSNYACPVEIGNELAVSHMLHPNEC